jgi:hypothetical protein
MNAKKEEIMAANMFLFTGNDQNVITNISLMSLKQSTHTFDITQRQINNLKYK